MRILCCLVFLMLIAFNAPSQTALINSATSGPVTQVYRLTDIETEALMQDPKAVTDAFFHTLADSYTYTTEAKKLSFGNYLQVRPVKNRLEYDLITRNNVGFQFINNQKDFQFTLTDHLGNHLSHATVYTANGKRISYDHRSWLYSSAYPKKDSYIKVVHNGISNYFTYEAAEGDNRHYHKNRLGKRAGHILPVTKLKKWFAKNKNAKKADRDVYRSFLVFSKPQYKPYDTVKFKAYILDAAGKSIATRKLGVLLDGRFEPRRIADLQPYSPGAYEYQFVLADSFDLRLDADYSIRLVDSVKDGVKDLASGNFRYEEYELKSLSFNVRADKSIHYPGAPIILFMKAIDENDLAVPDARIELVARLQNVSAFYGDSVFVKDTLWTKNMALDPVGETKLVLPDSIFPNAALRFSLQIKMLNSNNEVRTNNQYLSFNAKNQTEPKITAKFIKDSLNFSYEGSEPEQRQLGWLYKNAASGAIIDSQRVQLPLVIVADHRAKNYELRLDNGVDTTIALHNFSPDIQPFAEQKETRLNLAVANLHKIPFWYTVFSGDKVLWKGYTTGLDTAIKHSPRQAAHFRINYIWGQEEKTQEVSTFYNANQLDVMLLAPDMVYPGQKVNMKVRVLDTREQPVSGADLTAYAHTSKFQSAMPAVPKFGKLFYQRKTNPFEFEGDEIFASSNMKINWEKWGKELALDTIAYYRFTHPQPMYLTREPARDSITQFAPFVMKDGDFEAVNIIYVDEVPVFYYNAQQLQRYAFAITPGVHSIRLRTPDYEVWLKEMYFKKGEKTTFSILADTANQQAHVVKKKAILSNEEAERLNRYMIKITPNFGGTPAFLYDDSTRLWLNPTSMLGFRGQEQLVGPLKNSQPYFVSSSTRQFFLKEPGYTYTFTPGLIKQKSYKGVYAFDTVLSKTHALAEAYQQQVLRNKDQDSTWNEFLNMRSRTTLLFRNNLPYDTTVGRLQYHLDTVFTNPLPYIKNIMVSNPARPQNLLVLPGNSGLPALPAGTYTLFFLLRDNSYFKIDKVQVKPGGINYYAWKTATVHTADSFSIQLDSSIKATREATSWNSKEVPMDILMQFNSKGFDFSGLKNVMTGRIIDAVTKKPLKDVSVMIDVFAAGTTTDEKGRFKLNVPQKGKIKISCIGYAEEQLNAYNGNIGDIELHAATAMMDEVVVVGFGIQRKVSVTGASVSIEANGFEKGDNTNFTELLQGKAAGVNIMIRGSNSINGKMKPLIIVDGVPFDGELNEISPDDIESFNLMKGTDATAIYGSRAADGVIVVKTKKGNTTINEAGVIEPGTQRLRTRFSDEAFWQPRLITDEKGEASFNVTFPDDITNWKTRVIAINGNQQSGYLETAIKSFKTLSANFTSPLFAVEGDSMRIMGKLMNYTSFPEKLTRILKYNDRQLLNDSLSITSAHIDSTMITVNGTDSLSFEYTLQQPNGYFDGEIRKLPVVAAGVKETIGRFIYMDQDSVASHTFERDKGPGTVRAEASVFPVLLDEMRQLRDYEYLCNEQLASKLKSLLLEKKLRDYLKDSFKYEKHILDVIKRLNENKNLQNLWGWWQGTQEESWISLHVVEAMLQADAQGYTTKLNKDILYKYLLGKVAYAGAMADMNTLKLLHVLNGSRNIKDWVKIKDADSTYKKQKKNLYEWMQMLQLKQMAEIPVDLDSLMGLKKTTMFGGLYWGEERYHFWNNSIQNTLLAYRVLKAAGTYEKELTKIRQYFLEQRRNGQWRNTYESSLILETILPDLFRKDNMPKPATIAINGEMISQFPYEKKFTAGEKIIIDKQGDMPVYLTAYQQFQNQQPEKVSKDFEVRSCFMQNGFEVEALNGGTTTILRVEVTARADAEYVMIEVPIPAGCSYENKRQSFRGVETHREYFKNKTSIFCTKLGQGKYVFDIELMPRYSGVYNLNPAKAEMMYFPVFYGREGMKKVAIK